MKLFLTLLLISVGFSNALSQDTLFVPFVQYDTANGNYVIYYDSSKTDGTLFSTVLIPQSKVFPAPHVVVTLSQGILSYSYSIVNGLASQQGIYSFDLGSYMVDTAYTVPNHWTYGAYESQPFIQFLHDFQSDDIRPGDSLHIVLTSTSPPTIILARFSGRPEMGDLEFVREPDERVKGLIDSLKGLPGVQDKSLITIGPIDPTLLLDLSTVFDSLQSYTVTSYHQGWIIDESMMNKYLTLIQASNSAFDNGNQVLARSVLEHILSELVVDATSSLESEAYALLRYNAEYILDHLPAGSQVSTYSLFATHSLWLEQNSEVFSGDIGVNESGTAPFLDSQVELSLGIGTSTASGYSIKAHRIKVKQGSTVGSDVHYNELDNNGTITGMLHTPLTLPLTSTLPEFKPATPGTQNIEIPQNGTQTLQPGSYGDVLVRRNGKLILTGGAYHLASFNTGDNVQLHFQAPSEVRIAGKFDTDQGTYVGPEDTASLSASQIVFYVAGINGSNGNLGAAPKAAQIGLSNTVKANFYVPNGTLWIRQNSQATGAFIGKDVDVGIGVKIWLKSAF